ncbi:hypothetical protein K7X08_001567 [Anisodus acutangulus]|uniref:Uncharacterized protein n=1 Tax=Anisodus acutangulus TaxID=402998 RepID=A0A9Q1MNY6_9SOLA|nr:hypothetical protein K7X08_001567 [Anisodus acutangulus]
MSINLLFRLETRLHRVRVVSVVENLKDNFLFIRHLQVAIWRKENGVSFWRKHQGDEYGNDDLGFVGIDVADLLPENIDLDVDEDILNMEAQFEEFLQSSESGQKGIKSSLSDVNGLPKGSEALVKTLSLPKPKSPIEPPKYYEKPAKIVSPKNSLRRIQQPR